MNSDTSIVSSYKAADTPNEVAIPYEPSSEHPLPYQRIHALLRGRYRVAIVLSLLGAILGGIGGYLIVTPVFTSTGRVRIRATISPIIGNMKDTAIPRFETFMETQLLMVSSSRVVDVALQAPEYQAHYPETNSSSLVRFLSRLDVYRERQSEIIEISYTDSKPEAAQAAVNAVVDTYVHTYNEQDRKGGAERLTYLMNRKENQEQTISALEAQVFAIAREFGSDALERRYFFKLKELQMLESDLHATERALAAAEASVSNPRNYGSVQESRSVDELTYERISLLDPQMRSLLQARSEMMREIEYLRMAGFGEQHTSVRKKKATLRSQESKIEQHAIQFRTAYAEIQIDPMSIIEGHGATVADLERLHAQKESLQEMYDQAHAKTLELGRKNLKIKELQSDIATNRDWLEETKRSIDKLRVESAVSGRIEVIGQGNLPLRPANEAKQKQLVVVGVAIGGSLGIGLIMLVGIMDPRFLSSDDARSTIGQIRMLGILPSLPGDLSDPEHARIAAHSVHNIRTLMQLGADREDRRVFSITGPASDTGKTSLTIALGMSFAESGSKTLLVDCDMVGGALTTRMEAIARRRVGQILRQRGFLNNQQLDLALNEAKKTGRRLGEVCVEMKYLDQVDLSEALHIQEKMPIGMLEACAGENIETCVAETPIPGMWILPIGTAHPTDASRLSPNSIQRMLWEARQRFDVILVDTGSALTSLEASIVASEVDGTVLIVSRGNHRPLVEQTLRHLNSINANIAGVVFNRAESADFMKSTASSTSSGRPYVEADVEIVSGDSRPTKEMRRLGPVASAVASLSRRNGNGDSVAPKN